MEMGSHKLAWNNSRSKEKLTQNYTYCEYGNRHAMRPSRRQRTKASDSRESHRACAAHSHGRDRRAARRGLGHQEVALVRVTLTQGTRIKNGSTSTIWRPRMQRRSKKPSDPPPSSVSTYLKDVKSFCRWAKGDGILDIAPQGQGCSLVVRLQEGHTHARAGEKAPRRDLQRVGAGEAGDGTPRRHLNDHGLFPACW